MKSGKPTKRCAVCGHDPACGHAAVTMGDVETWYCHNDDHSCYVEAAQKWNSTGIAPRFDSISVEWQ